MNCIGCGQPSQWVAQYGQWWCAGCASYLQPLDQPAATKRRTSQTTKSIAVLVLGIGLLVAALVWLDHPNVGGSSDAGAITALKGAAGFGGVMIVVGLVRLLSSVDKK